MLSTTEPDGTAAEISRLVKQYDYVHLLEREGKMGLGTAYIDGFRLAIETIHPRSSSRWTRTCSTRPRR